MMRRQAGSLMNKGGHVGLSPANIGEQESSPPYCIQLPNRRTENVAQRRERVSLLSHVLLAAHGQHPD